MLTIVVRLKECYAEIQLEENTAITEKSNFIIKQKKSIYFI